MFVLVKHYDKTITDLAFCKHCSWLVHNPHIETRKKKFLQYSTKIAQHKISFAFWYCFSQLDLLKQLIV